MTFAGSFSSIEKKWAVVGRTDVGPKIKEFAKLFWANRGNHNDLTAQKVLPEFTFEELKAAG